MSKSHPDQWTINPSCEPADPALVAALAQLATTQIADSGGPVGVVGPPLRHLAGPAGLCGTAVTVWTKPGDILLVLKAVDSIRPGDVLVIDGGGREDAAVVGDIVGETIAGLGAVGLVVDGAVRDVDGLDAAGLPTFARGAHPATGSNTGPGAINVAVQCGGVVVRPGDVVRGDASGLVVVPREHLAQVVELTTAVAEREDEWRRRIAAGESLPAATGIDAILAEVRGAPERPTP
ncbi:MAG: dimethylmenaquinone methyltransferase [Pseudonocardia sp.]|uniref:RraA family protein n=1 Tax=Pseudonocardia sp. TaxID=60912 RepID=UPI001AC09D43|nr:dimethylmenaquinone methyltransferase [Pseudonocardia sp.]MBN9103155.1 dimethylmenaquinone methyltransferase [Pseudonocardia sp.]